MDLYLLTGYSDLLLCLRVSDVPRLDEWVVSPVDAAFGSHRPDHVKVWELISGLNHSCNLIVFDAVFDSVGLLPHPDRVQVLLDICNYSFSVVDFSQLLGVQINSRC